MNTDYYIFDKHEDYEKENFFNLNENKKFFIDNL